MAPSTGSQGNVKRTHVQIKPLISSRKTFSLTPKNKIESLVYEGVPDSIRGSVWMALVAQKNSEHTMAEKDEIYRKFLLMPDNKAVEQIKLDLARTLTHHRMFEEKLGEGQMKLMRILKVLASSKFE